MTPAARVAAAIEILDLIGEGNPAEKTLTNWARGHRFAGSGDRAAIRDHVFDVLRRRRSYSVIGGGTDGRALMIGAIRASGDDPANLFTGQGYGPAPLEDKEKGTGDVTFSSDAEQFDCPDWLYPTLQASLSEDTNAVLAKMQTRAPVFLRANLKATTRDAAIAELAGEGISSEPHDLSPSAILVTGSPRKVQIGETFKNGLVELQDAASQAIVDALPLVDGMEVLDYCAGGGGKSLAMAARANVNISAHDLALDRMKDIPVRASRAGVDIEILEDTPNEATKFDLVLCDVPCSGSGSWRRAPEAKWNFDRERLEGLIGIQQDILSETKALVASGGTLAYVTCSLLREENQDQVDLFLSQNSGWKKSKELGLTPLDGGDGFYLSLLTRE